MIEYTKNELSQREENNNGNIDSFAELLEKNLESHSNTLELNTGDMVEGKILKITSEYVFIDIGQKTEGIIALNEFDKLTEPKEGDIVKAVVSKRLTDSIVLSFSKAQELNSWEHLKQAFNNNLKVSAKVVEVVKNGIVADISPTIKGFIPISQIDKIQLTEEDLERYKGRTLECKILNLTQGPLRKIVLSHKIVMIEEELMKKEQFFVEHAEGDIVTGVVKDYASFGAFIDLGGFDGLLHVTDLGWGRNNKPSEVAPKGAKLKLVITRLDNETKKINLSLKALTKNPWDSISNNYKVGDIVNGIVVKILHYGAFVNIDDVLEGFVHVSDMSWSKKINHPNDILKINSKVECKILDIDKIKKRISLGIKQVSENPWSKVEKLYPKGLKVTVTINKVLNSGVIVSLDEDIKGFISKDNYSWNRSKMPTLKADTEIEAKILGYDEKNYEVKLGLKQLTENPWDKEEMKVGSIVEGVISNVTNFGVFLKINDEIEGLIPKFQCYDPNEYDSFENAKTDLKIGNKLQAMVQSINAHTHKLSLSIRDIKEASTKQELKKHLIQEEDTHSVNFGDYINKEKFDKGE